MEVDCFANLIYPAMITLYVIFFAFFFKKGLETIIFIQIFILTVFFALKIMRDIMTKAGGDYAMTDRKSVV